MGIVSCTNICDISDAVYNIMNNVRVPQTNLLDLLLRLIVATAMKIK